MNKFANKSRKFVWQMIKRRKRRNRCISPRIDVFFIKFSIQSGLCTDNLFANILSLYQKPSFHRVSNLSMRFVRSRITVFFRILPQGAYMKVTIKCRTKQRCELRGGREREEGERKREGESDESETQTIKLPLFYSAYNKPLWERSLWSHIHIRRRRRRRRRRKGYHLSPILNLHLKFELHQNSLLPKISERED